MVCSAVALAPISASFAQWEVYSRTDGLLCPSFSLSNLLDSTWYIATCLSVPRALIDAVWEWERDGREVDGLSGRDRGNEIIADLLAPLSSLSFASSVAVCVRVFVCM